MTSNLEKYRDEINDLVVEGTLLRFGLRNEMGIPIPEETIAGLSETSISKLKRATFRDRYQKWYNASLAAIQQLLPIRVDDFKASYRKHGRNDKVLLDNYSIEDYLLGLSLRSYSKESNQGLIIRKFELQYEIVSSLTDRLDSSLFEIQQLVEADMFDSEIDAAESLAKRGFLRGAGAICGVVLEKHLKSVAVAHNLKITKKVATINDLNELLKNSNVIDVAQWRHLQFLGDIRNICDHDKLSSPTKENLDDLISGVRKVLKTIY